MEETSYTVYIYRRNSVLDVRWGFLASYRWEWGSHTELWTCQRCRSAGEGIRAANTRRCWVTVLTKTPIDICSRTGITRYSKRTAQDNCTCLCTSQHRRTHTSSIEGTARIRPLSSIDTCFDLGLLWRYRRRRYHSGARRGHSGACRSPSGA